MKKQDFVKILNLFIVGSSEIFREKYPIFLDVLSKSKNPYKDWEFFMTVSAVGMFIVVNSGNINNEDTDNIIKQLNKIDKQGSEGLENFLSFIDIKSTLDLTQKAGYWVLLNMLSAHPNQKESEELIPAIGMYLKKLITEVNVNLNE